MVISKYSLLLFLFFNFYSHTAFAQQDSNMLSGKKLFNLGQYSEAIPEFTLSIHQNKDNFIALLFRGECYLYLNDLKKAEKDLNASRDGLSDSYLPQLNADLGMLYNKKGENKKAIDYFTAAINAKPDFAIAFNNRGIAWQDMGNYRNALADYSAAIRVDSNFALAYSNRGSATYYDQNIAEAHELDIESAIRDFSKALDLNPELCLAMRNRGLCYQFLKEYNKALDDLNNAVHCEPQNPVNFIIRGTVKYDKDLYSEAAGDYRQAISLDPDQTEAYIQLGIVLGKLNRTDEALASEDEAMKTDKHYSPMISYARAQIYAQAGDTVQMIKYLEKARKQDYFKTRKNYEDFFKAKEFAPYQKDKSFRKFTSDLKSKGATYFEK